MQADPDPLLSVTVAGITPLELRELESKLPGAVTIVEENPAPQRPGTAHPEPVTAIVVTVTLTALALQTLAIIVTRPRKGSRQDITVKRRTKDETLSITVKSEQYASEAPKKEVIDAIAKALKVDLSKLSTVGTDKSDT
jgi:hypothetical protein